MTAIAVGMVGTAGVAAAATVGGSPAAPIAIEPAAVETAIVDQLPAGYGDFVLPDVTLPDLPTTVPTPPLPTVPALPSIPGAPSLPVDPSALAASATQAVTQVAALLPSPAQLQAVVLSCVSDISALAPAPAPAVAANPLGFLTGLLGGLGASTAPKLPDPAVVQAAITSCVADVLGVLPDPAALASALTAAFGPTMPAPIASLVAQLTGQVPAVPDAGHLIDLVTGLIGASGSPAGLLNQLTGAIDAVVPTPLNELISFPLAIVNQIFGTLGLA